MSPQVFAIISFHGGYTAVVVVSMLRVVWSKVCREVAKTDSIRFQNQWTNVPMAEFLLTLNHDFAILIFVHLDNFFRATLNIRASS
jgi:hypothetical protein